MNNSILIQWEVYKVSPEYVKDGAAYLAYEYRPMPGPFSSPIMTFVGIFEAFTKAGAINLYYEQLRTR